MKKTFKVVLSLICAMILTLSCFHNTLAEVLISSESAKETTIVTKENATQILVDFGVDSEEAFNMDENEKIEMAKAILRNPETVDISSTIKYFDRLEELETIVNLTDDEMYISGFSDNEIKYYRDQIQALKKMSDEELFSEFQVSDETELKMIKAALEPNENFRNNIKVLEKTVCSSATISPSILVLSLSKWNNSSVTNKPVSYRVYTYFNWNQKPFVKNEDQYGIVWGGGLAQNDHTRYYYLTDATPPYIQTVTGTGSSNICLSRITQTANAGLIHYFRISMNSGTGLSFNYMTGYTFLTIFQNQQQNLAADLAAMYAHRTIIISGAGLSINQSGGSVSFSCSWGYSYGTPDSLTFNY